MPEPAPVEVGAREPSQCMTPNGAFGAAPPELSPKSHLVQHHDRELTLRLSSRLLGAPFGSCALAVRRARAALVLWC